MWFQITATPQKKNCDRILIKLILTLQLQFYQRVSFKICIELKKEGRRRKKHQSDNIHTVVTAQQQQQHMLQHANRNYPSHQSASPLKVQIYKIKAVILERLENKRAARDTDEKSVVTEHIRGAQILLVAPILTSWQLPLNLQSDITRPSMMG